MSRSRNDCGVWLLHDAVCVRKEAIGISIDADATCAPCQPHIDSAMAALRGLLLTVRGASVSVRLGFPWVRHMIVPWQPRLHTEAAWLAWARATCDAQGIDHHDSHLALSAARFGQSRLALVADRALMQAIVALCNSQGMKLRRVTSTFADAAFLYRRQLADTASALAVCELGTMTCALRHDNAWTAIASLRDGGTLHERLAAVASLALSSGATMPVRIDVIGDQGTHDADRQACAPADHPLHWLGPHLPRLRERTSA